MHLTMIDQCLKYPYLHLFRRHVFLTPNFGGKQRLFFFIIHYFQYFSGLVIFKNPGIRFGLMVVG